MEIERKYKDRLFPTPRFVIFYNGMQEQPERMLLKLSDAFEKQIDEPELELKVLMLNINFGKNQEVLEKCKLLHDYMIYVTRVRTYASEMNIREAVERAVDECIKEGILKEFLSKYRAEAIQMSIFEYDEEKEMKLIREAEYKVGLEEGRSQGIEKGSQGLIETCREFGLTESETVIKLMDKFSISKEQAEVKVKQYWNGSKTCEIITNIKRQ